MNTPTHLLISAAVLTRRGDADEPKRNIAILAGALLPDAAIYLLFVWARLIERVPEAEVWRNLYWQEPWQSLVAIGNSIPLFAAVTGIGLALKRPIVTLIGLSALLHLAFDLPFHADDAHPHFWPLTDWRFHSPLSYWDENHFGTWVSLAEGLLAIGLIVLLWRRFEGRIVRGALVLALVSYIAVPVYFTLMLG